MFRGENAKTVEIDIWGMKKVAMTQEAGGWWSATVRGIEKGFHYYGCIVNGVDVVDANAPVGYGGFRAINFLRCRRRILKNTGFVRFRMALYI